MSRTLVRRPHRRKNPNEVIRTENGLPFGNKTVFTPEQEKGFVLFLKYMTKLRLPRTRKTFPSDIQFFVNYYRVKNPFTDGIPGYYWTMRFIQDNGFKFLTDAEALLVSEKILKIGEFIEECVELVKTENKGLVLDSGKRLLVLEMKMFLLDGNIKIAVLVVCDAEGKLFKPFIIHDSHLPKEAVGMFQMGLVFKETADGDLDKESLDFILEQISKAVDENKVQRPVALLAGHDVVKHHTIVTWLTCVHKQIILLPMPSCITETYESMELGLFTELVPAIHHSLKTRFSHNGRVWTTTAFTQVVREHTRNMNAKPFAKNLVTKFSLDRLLDIPRRKRSVSALRKVDVRPVKKRRAKLECVLETEHLSIKVFK